MKVLPILILLILATMKNVSAQNSAVLVASHVAQKMKDSLSLDEGKKQQIYNLNMHLNQQKMAKRIQYAGTDSVTNYLQKVENTRDSLYHTVLSDSLFLIYKQKKRMLITAN